MFTLILTLSADFLAQLRSLAAELPHVCIDTNRTQEITFRPEVTEAEANHWADTYRASGTYDKVELIRK